MKKKREKKVKEEIEEKVPRSTHTNATAIHPHPPTGYAITHITHSSHMYPVTSPRHRSVNYQHH
ncbi:hypothetical protein E2C01_081005 [Portunus trituberculatus]|uniref:Uncharacterized protein n=1 Tax=Portunus trituberculatus TaxID=210409 RepID=A0A5B7IVG9_PORTR|nr:hypothetical protein [Portunus trituberculatus]